MADLLELSSRLFDSGELTEPPNRITQELSELADDIAMVESFSHVVIFRTDDGLVLFDTSHDLTARPCVEAMRRWTDLPIHSIVYTHGHVDHVGGSGAFMADNADRGPTPQVIGHENIRPRFQRYRLTDGYNNAINARQFGGRSIGSDELAQFLAPDVVEPTTEFETTHQFRVGQLEFELRHDRGETDDHTWAWIPAHKAICVGDSSSGCFPNAGNPQKVQRYPVEWAAAMRAMAEQGAELLLPAHGLPISGRKRIHTVLTDAADALEDLVQATVDLMNQGARLDDIVHSVKVDPSVLDKPYLRPIYDEPEFIVRNLWRLYGGWYDGNPAHLKPPTDAVLAATIAELSGGVASLVARAVQAASDEDLRLACSLVELAVQADPDNREAHGARAEIYAQRRRVERSLMARGIFGHASRSSRALTEKD